MYINGSRNVLTLEIEGRISSKFPNYSLIQKQLLKEKQLTVDLTQQAA